VEGEGGEEEKNTELGRRVLFLKEKNNFFSKKGEESQKGRRGERNPTKSHDLGGDIEFFC